MKLMKRLSMFALVGILGALLFCLVGLSLRISRRRKAFDNQLGDMLTMIANALRAGFSFMQALEHIANEMDDPVRSEIHKVVRDVNIGVTLESALENMTHRICSKDFELVVAAVLIQRQVGGNLAQILDSISETINDRIRMRREVQALTAQGRLSGFIMALLPLVMGALLQTINPQYMEPLFTEPIGRMALGIAAVLVILAFVVIRRIVEIDI